MKRLRDLWIKLWHAPLVHTVVDTMEAWGSRITTEVEVTNRRGQVIGYWACGSWDPNGIYRGDEATGELA
jgi:hypothetical protein